MKKLEEVQKLARLLKGLTVLGCRPASPAALAGVQYGDILLSVNGQPTPDWTSFIAARKECGASMSLVLFRDGEKRELTVDLPKQKATNPTELLSELLESPIFPTGPSSFTAASSSGSGDSEAN